MEQGVVATGNRQRIGEILRTGSARQVELRRTRRIVQGLVDTVAEDEVYLLALTAIKSYDDSPENHSANVAIHSIALGRRLGLCRQDLAGW